MLTIQQPLVEATWERLNNLDQPATERLVERFNRDQPFLTAYLLAGEEEHSAEEERGQLLFLGLFVYETFRAAGRSAKQVAGDTITAAEEANVSMLSRLEADSEAAFQDAAANLMNNHNQMPLYGVVMEICFAGNEDTPDLVSDSSVMYLQYLKVMIDCLDA